LALNGGGDGARGWGIPMATDIAFALGVLALLGPRIPSQVRVLLLAIAIVDDIGAILVIAAFYSESISLEALGVAALLFLVVIGMIRGGLRNLIPYFIAGALMWVAMLKSGVHPTITGVLLAGLVPSVPYFSERTFRDSAQGLMERFGDAVDRGDKDTAEAVLGQLEELTQGTEAPLERLERAFHPWISFIVVPVFALANAGVELSGDLLRDAASSSVTLGIGLGLLAGKLLGIVGFSWMAVRLGVGSLPRGVGWRHLVGVGLLAGIGFTVSLFITGLAFDDLELVSEAKIGILGASVVAGAAGYGFLRRLAVSRGAGEPEALE